MPATKYINIKIDNKQVDVSDIEELSIPISYALEDERDFQQKKSSMALDLVVPATKNNDSIFASMHNPNIEVEHQFRECVIETAGIEILKGKALVREASKINDRPESYSIDCYGNNGDWMIPLQEKTLHDFVSSHTHVYDVADITASWYYDGMDEERDYFYAPVRYKFPFHDNDSNVKITDLRPSISIYWIIYRAFQSIGYKLVSNFFDSDFFRGHVMPWTWGDFLFMDDNVVAPLKFKATGPAVPVGSTDGVSYFYLTNLTGVYTLGANTSFPNASSDTFNMSNDVPPLGYDNGGNYSYSNGIMTWEYNTDPGDLLGVIDVVFRLSFPGAAEGTATIGAPGDVDFRLKYRKNGGSWTEILREDTGGHLYHPAYYSGNTAVVEMEFTLESLSPGDIIDFRIDCHMSVNGSPFQQAAAVAWSRSDANPGAGYANPQNLIYECFLEVKRFKKTAGSVVDFKLFEEFKNYKFLDLLRGIIDFYNIEIQTDSVNKVVVMEPMLPYYLNNNPGTKIEGYFNNNVINWTAKRDHSKHTVIENFSDSFRELVFSCKDDPADGGVKLYNDRNNITASAAKYVFPNRFKEGKEEHKNRFFAPTIHYKMEQWESYQKEGAYPIPQVVALIPENIANTSADAGEFKFQPRMCFARGINLSDPNLLYKNGRFKFEGSLYACPQMFAVNYNPGGENDPNLTYNDQLINGTVNHGLLRRFFLPRLAIMRHGKRLRDNFHLNNSDIANWFHREKIAIDDGLYLLFNINDYQPLKSESTSVTLWKYYPADEADSDSVFPSLASVQGETLTGSDDIMYKPLLLLPSDIPQ